MFLMAGSGSNELETENLDSVSLKLIAGSLKS